MLNRINKYHYGRGFLLIMKMKLSQKSLLVMLSIFSVNAYAFDDTYLECKGGNETYIFGFEVTIGDKLRNLGSDGFEYATGFVANSNINEFDNKSNNGAGDVIISSNTISYDYHWDGSSYGINRVTGVATHYYSEKVRFLDTDIFRNKKTSKIIGNCNKISESQAKRKAKQLYKKTEPRRQF